MNTAVVTGLGLVSPLGRKPAEVFDALAAGRSGLRAVPEGHAAHGWLPVAGIAPPVDGREVLPPTETRCVDRFVLLALTAADDALADAGLVVGRDVDPHRTAVVLATGGGGLETFEQQSHRRLERGRPGVSPYLLPGMLSNMATARIAIKHGIRGYSSAVVTACAAGAQAVAEGLRLIRSGDADVVVCGGTESSLHPTIAAAFTNARALAHGWEDPEEASRPFDARRNGFVLGEGSAVLVLERTGHADARGAAGYADVLGWGASTDAHHPTMPRPDGEGAADAMRAALANAGLAPGDIDYVNAHGTGTPLGDPIEAAALLATYGRGRPADRPLLLGSVKSNLGHTQAAAGVAGVMKAVLAVRAGTLPRTLHAERPTEHVDWDAGVLKLLDEAAPWPETGRARRAAVSSFGMSGTNAHVIVEQAPEEEAPAGPSAEGPARTPSTLPWPVSAHSPAALRGQAARLLAHLAQHPDATPADLGYSLATTRARLEHRAVLLVDDTLGAAEDLRALAADGASPTLLRGSARSGPDLALVLPGEPGTVRTWRLLADQLPMEAPVFAERIGACEQALAGLVDWSLWAVLADDPDAPSPALPQVAGPVLFSVLVALAAQWRAWGVRPTAVLGTGVAGEAAAAVAEGRTALADGLREVLSGRAGITELPTGKGLFLLPLISPATVAALGPDATVLAPEAGREASARLAGELFV
ncbi:beta-ketoacyl synthase N-terminal-like domain-containing protein, partial [Kitasatospora sp. NPDC093558]|uniref:beta-ketoacyl synthase N-terminal-like domain-containing protein n=1 Tax=Kitasatospora sp. NPDC093558 TaxID=3155201 RepID=UPI00343D22AC